MNANDVRSIVSGLDAHSAQVIIKDLAGPFKEAIQSLNKSLAAENNRDQLTPPPALILEAFRLCPVANVRVVLLAQDPYPKKGDAQGLAFSVPATAKMPPSVKKIADCLQKCGLSGPPESGDLTKWAKQGVLLLNCALTTIIGKPNHHAACWKSYTDEIIKSISRLDRKIIFILLGNFAKEKAQLVDGARHLVLTWGHPSPVSPVNGDPSNPLNFLHCDVFTRANENMLSRGEKPIDWSLGALSATATTANKTIIGPQDMGMDDPCSEPGKLWVFTDGASRSNGYAKCVASWGFFMTDSIYAAKGRGMVPPVDIPGKAYKTSNNRGELMGILEGLRMIPSVFDFESVVVVSDSEYAIGCSEKYSDGWVNLHPDQLSEKLNVDLIFAIRSELERVRKICPCELRHVRGHTGAPADTESHEWFLWKGNDIADKMCELALIAATGRASTPRAPKKGRALIKSPQPKAEVGGFVDL